MKQTVYLVTGASGHLGQNLVRRLMAQKSHVRALVLPNDPFASHLPAGVELCTGNVCDRDSLIPFFTVPEGTDLIVIHAAGIITISAQEDPKVRAVNVGGTRNIIELCKKFGVKKLVYVSSVHAIPELPKSHVMHEITEFDPEKVSGLYAKTKAEATALVLQAAKEGLNASVCHPSGMLGPYDYQHGHLTELVFEDMRGRLPACVRGGYDFVDVRDVADAIVTCCEKGRSGVCYLLSGRYVSIPALLRITHQLRGSRFIPPAVPFKLVKAFAPVSEAISRAMHRKPLFTAYSMETLQANALFTHRRAADELGFSPRPIEATLQDTMAFLTATAYPEKKRKAIQKKAARRKLAARKAAQKQAQ